MRYNIVTTDSNNKTNVEENLTYDEVYNVYNDNIEKITWMKITADNGHHMVKTYSIDRTWYNDKCVVTTDKLRHSIVIIDELEPEFRLKMNEKFKRWAKKF